MPRFCNIGCLGVMPEVELVVHWIKNGIDYRRYERCGHRTSRTGISFTCKCIFASQHMHEPIIHAYASAANILNSAAFVRAFTGTSTGEKGNGAKRELLRSWTTDIKQLRVCVAQSQEDVLCLHPAYSYAPGHHDCFPSSDACATGLQSIHQRIHLQLSSVSLRTVHDDVPGVRGRDRLLSSPRA